jgi:ATP-dependent Clp protease ATP-binding subunit ClpC
MWRRFTERARKAIFYAQEEAQRLVVSFISTRHLLVGLLRESDSVATKVLERLQVSPDKIREELEMLPRGDAEVAQDMALSPRAKRVIDLAYDEGQET